MGTPIKASMLALLLFFLLSPIAFSVSNDGLIRVGLKKRKVDRIDQLRRYVVSTEGNVRKEFGFRSTLEDSDSGIIALTNDRDTSYFGEIGIGTPPQKFTDLSRSCAHGSLYRHRQLVVLTQGTFAAIQYGTGSISGFYSQDSVTVGELVVKEQDFIETTDELDAVFLATKFDGILGLAFQENSVQNVVPVWYNMVNEGLVEEAVFSFWLNRNVDEEEGGEIVLVGLTLIIIGFEMGDVLIGDKSTGFCKYGCQAFADSGTSLLAGPTVQLADKICSHLKLCTFDGARDVSSIIESVVDHNNDKSSGGIRDEMCTFCEMTVVWMQNEINRNETEDNIINYVNELCDNLPTSSGESLVDCNSLSSMPNTAFTIGGKIFELTPEQYVLKMGEGEAALCLSGFSAVDLTTVLGPLW
ncbi:hypothetical protein L6452_28305 [Arctium lappa]|uniref:Uncharacterized protein n=1 Tax=Arctium lappa TaxID=4217 RepID=A0ACB8ZX30_ARCLA|nr:hypothetical protein L6452_28305 [Arctium lappa]